MDRKKDSRPSSMTRRHFLQGAVMGVVAAHLPPGLRNSQAGSEQEEIEIIGGWLTALEDQWIELQDGYNKPRRVAFDGSTSFWKGGDSTPNALMKGDEILIRALAQRELALRVWSNLTRVSGKVIRVIKKNGGLPLFVLEDGSLHGPQAELLLEVSERTLFGNPWMDISPTPKDIIGRDKRLILEGDYVDVIGEQTPEGIRGTTVILYPARGTTSRPETPPQVEADQTIINPDGTVTALYFGHSVWYDCATGAGRCATCNTSNAYQSAWPHMDDCQGNCTGSCCDCSSGCKNQIKLSCGQSFNVYDACTSKSRTVSVVDCGPCQNCWCSSCCNGGPGTRCCQGCGYPDCANRQTPIIDLTKPTFTYFRNPDAGWGCFSCHVSV